MKKKLEVILKVAERCNIDCTYCYFFNGFDKSYKTHPKRISIESIDSLIIFLKDAVKSHDLDIVQIDFHGGEPLIVKKEYFTSICESFIENLSDLCHLRLCLQTNATLVDDDWIEIFSKFNICISTSLDGNKEQNDKYRIGFNGEGTYDATIKGIKKLQDAYLKGQIPEIGLLCVINPENNPKELYNHFTKDLGFTLIDFLLPDCSYDDLPPFESIEYGNFLIGVFDSWKNDKKKENISIRIFNSILSLLLGGYSYVTGYGVISPNAITVGSDGSLFPDDLLRSCKDYIEPNMSIEDTSYAVFKDWIEETIQAKSKNYSQECLNCCWFKVCGGGHPLNRYSSENEFNNVSVYCEGLKKMYSECAKFLVEGRIPLEEILENLELKERLTPNIA
jgi:uncharacterized protein